ncbi:MAG: ABC transporter permease [Candidatus Dormibacteria bacterium]
MRDAAVLDAHVSQRGGAGRAFVAILRRDVVVTLRQFPVFLAQVLVQPLGLLFVFGRVLSDLGFTRNGYATQLFPGIVAMTIMLTALQSVALPMVIEFSFTREIEDRLMAPLPTAWVAVEKIVFAAGRALIAGIVMFPVGILVLGMVPFVPANLPLLLAVMVLGSIAGGAMGLSLGTIVAAGKINIVFALVLTPLIFTGCSQYPWPLLSKLPWFQAVTLLNPMTYMSEGIRSALIPDVPHMTTWVTPIALIVAITVFGSLGLRGFNHRAKD